MRPGTRIRNIEMISATLGWKLGARLVLNEGSEDGLGALEFSGFVAGLDPVEDGTFLVLIGDLAPY